MRPQGGEAYLLETKLVISGRIIVLLEMAAGLVVIIEAAFGA